MFQCQLVRAIRKIKMSATNTMIVLSKLQVYLGRVEKGSVVNSQKYMHGYIGKPEVSPEVNPNVTHDFIMTGVDVCENKGFICECGEAFMDSKNAEQHFHKFTTKEREQTTVRFDKVKPSKARLLMESVFISHGLRMSPACRTVCIEKLGVTRRAFISAYFQAKKRVELKKENPYKKYITTALKVEAESILSFTKKEVQQRRSKPFRVIKKKNQRLFFKSKNHLMLEAIVQKYGGNVSREFQILFAKGVSISSRLLIYHCKRAVNERKRSGESAFKHMLTPEIEEDAIKRYWQIMDQLHKTSCKEVTLPIKEKSNNTVPGFKKTATWRLVMEALFEQQGVELDSKYRRACADALIVTEQTIRWYCNQVKKRLDMKLDNPYAHELTDEIRERARVLHNDALAEGGKVNPIVDSNKPKKRTFPGRTERIMAYIFKEKGVNHDNRYLEACAKFLGTNTLEIMAYWEDAKKQEEKKNNRGKAFDKKIFTKGIQKEAMELHERVMENL